VRAASGARRPRTGWLGAADLRGGGPPPNFAPPVTHPDDFLAASASQSRRVIWPSPTPRRLRADWSFYDALRRPGCVSSLADVGAWCCCRTTPGPSPRTGCRCSGGGRGAWATVPPAWPCRIASPLTPTPGAAPSGSSTGWLARCNITGPRLRRRVTAPPRPGHRSPQPPGGTPARAGHGRP